MFTEETAWQGKPTVTAYRTHVPSPSLQLLKLPLNTHDQKLEGQRSAGTHTSQQRVENAEPSWEILGLSLKFTRH